MGQTYTEQLLKRKYSSNSKVVNQSIVNTRFLRDIKRTTNPGGESWNSFLIISGGVGWSGSRTGAQAIADQGGQRGNGAFQQIRNSYGKIAGEVTISEFDIKQGDSGDAAALRATATHVDNHLKMQGQTAEWQILGHRGMYVCRGTISGGVFTITSNAEHITRIRKDMLLVASTADGTSGSLVSGGSIGYVTKVQGRSGTGPTFTVSTTSGGSAASPSGWEAAGPIYVFIYETWKGANGGAGVDGGVNQGFLIDTVDSWVPAAAPTNTLFKNMDRTEDELLGGVRLISGEVQTLNILQRFELLAVTGRSRFGWNDESGMKCYIHTSRFHEANQLLQRTDMRQQGFSGTAERTQYGYNVIKMCSIGGNVELVDNPLMDPDYCWMTDPGMWTLHSSAGWPSVMDEDGLRFVRKSTQDAYSLQYTGYGSLRTEDPSKTGRCPLD